MIDYLVVDVLEISHCSENWNCQTVSQLSPQCISQYKPTDCHSCLSRKSSLKIHALTQDSYE